MEDQNTDFEGTCDNVVSLDEYRKRIVPSADEVEVALRDAISTSVDPLEAEMAEALLEMYGAGLLDVRRDRDGGLLYSLKNAMEPL